MKTQLQNPPSVWVSDRQLAQHYNVSRATIWRWTKDGRRPKPTKLSPGATRWKLADAAASLENQSA